MRGENNPNYGKTGENNPNYGRNHSEESRRKISKKLKGKFAGEKSPNYGKRGKNSPNYGKKHTEEYKAKMSEDRMGEKNPFYGRKHSEETRKNMSLIKTKTFSVISPDGEIIHSKNCSKFCKDNNLTNSEFSKLLNGKIKCYKGFRLYNGEDT